MDLRSQRRWLLVWRLVSVAVGDMLMSRMGPSAQRQQVLLGVEVDTLDVNYCGCAPKGWKQETGAKAAGPSGVVTSQ